MEEKFAQKFIEDTPVTENQNDKNWFKIRLKTHNQNKKIQQQIAQNFDNQRLHHKVNKTVIENEQQPKQTSLIPVHSDQVKLNQYQDELSIINLLVNKLLITIDWYLIKLKH